MEALRTNTNPLGQLAAIKVPSPREHATDCIRQWEKELELQRENREEAEAQLRDVEGVIAKLEQGLAQWRAWLEAAP